MTIVSPAAAPIPSVPELAAERDAAWARLTDLAMDPCRERALPRGWCAAHYAWEVAELRWQSAVWRLAVESHRWRRLTLWDLLGSDELRWWWAQRDRRHRWMTWGAWPAPGREVAVRERAAVIGAEVVAAVNAMVVRRLERRLALAPPRPAALLEGGRGRV